MKKLTIIIFLILTVGCRYKKTKIIYYESPQSTSRIYFPKTKENEFFFYIDENKPVIEDQYLYSPTIKKFIKRNMNGIDWYLVDWNDNGIYDEVGIDYIGVKNKYDRNPYIEILKDSININYNGISFLTKSKDDFKTIQKIPEKVNTKLSIITKLIPVELEDGTMFLPQSDKDTLVLYFWAIWCSACVEELKYANENITKINNAGIDFIPIAYKSFGIKEYFEKNDIHFKPLIAGDRAGNDFRLYSLSQTFVYDKKGNLIGNNINLKN